MFILLLFDFYLKEYIRKRLNFAIKYEDATENMKPRGSMIKQVVMVALK